MTWATVARNIADSATVDLSMGRIAQHHSVNPRAASAPPAKSHMPILLQSSMYLFSFFTILVCLPLRVMYLRTTMDSTEHGTAGVSRTRRAPVACKILERIFHP